MTIKPLFLSLLKKLTLPAGASKSALPKQMKQKTNKQGVIRCLMMDKYWLNLHDI